MIARILTAAAVIVPAAMLATCTDSAPHGDGSDGIVTGQAPICYGPAPTNLKPVAVIRAVRTDGLSRSVTVRTTNAHHTYRLTLPAGTYRISTYSGHVSVIVRAGKTTHHADLPQPSCL